MMTIVTPLTVAARRTCSVNGAQAQLGRGRVEVVRRRVTRSGMVKLNCVV
jgi:hypothetical protein